jgi:hypothetical protein
MQAVSATLPRDAPRVEALSQPLIEDWTTFIRAMEAYYAAPVRQTPAEVLAAASWAACVGLHPPAVPAADRATDARPRTRAPGRYPDAPRAGV